MAEQQPKGPPPEQPAQAAPAAAADQQTPPSTPSTPDEEIARLVAELEDAKDRALRGWAELENYRKRVGRQIEEERRYAALPLVRDLLPVFDNMKRAIQAAGRSSDGSVLLEGVKLVAQQLENVLQRHHCTPILALHQPFDPNCHQAILHQPSAEFPPNTVLEEVQQGFRLHDRVVRPSHVIVSSAAEEAQAGAPRDEEDKATESS